MHAKSTGELISFGLAIAQSEVWSSIRWVQTGNDFTFWLIFGLSPHFSERLNQKVHWPILDFDKVIDFDTGADLRFWFVRGTGRGPGDGSPRRGPGAELRWPVGGLGPKPPEARRMLRHEADKNIYEEKKTSPYRLILYNSIINIIISSTHSFVCSHFCLKIQNAGCGLQSQWYGPQWQPVLHGM